MSAVKSSIKLPPSHSRPSRNDFEVNPEAYLEGGKTTKIERYGWSQLGAAGEFRMVPKSQLGVDHSYQRDPIEGTKRFEIASRFNWLAFGALVVARRADGSLLIVDGQNRFIAAMRRADVDELPCMIFDLDDLGEEARAFLETNLMRRSVGAVDKFKAHVLVGDPVATEAKRLADSAGIEVTARSPVPNSIKCIGVFQKLIRLYPETTRKVWPLVVELSAGEQVSEIVLSALVHIEHFRVDPSVSLLRQPWRGRVLHLGSKGIKEGAIRAASYYTKGGAKVWSSGVLQALNKGVRNRFAIKSPLDESPSVDE